MPNTSIDVGGFTIGQDSPVYMIAEIGINHNGSLDIAKRLIDATFATDWHCAKFQKRTPEICVPDAYKGVMRDTPWGRMTYLEYRRRVEFGPTEYGYIDKYCREKPLSWSASVWDLPSLEFILKFNAPLIKIPSAKSGERDLLVQAARSGTPLILSTGMTTVEELDLAVETLEKHSRGDYVLLHTHSAYPAPHAELNLRTIQTLRERYHCLVGYSGHEDDLEPSVAAVLLGARVIERHVTLDHRMWGSDHAASLEVHAMDILHKRIKGIAFILGDGVKRLLPSESAARDKLRGTPKPISGDATA